MLHNIYKKLIKYFNIDYLIFIFLYYIKKNIIKININKKLNPLKLVNYFYFKFEVSETIFVVFEAEHLPFLISTFHPVIGVISNWTKID